MTTLHDAHVELLKKFYDVSRKIYYSARMKVDAQPMNHAYRWTLEHAAKEFYQYRDKLLGCN